MRPSRALLYARTLRHLQPRQVRNQLARRLLPRRPVRAPTPLPAWRTGLRPPTPYLDPPVSRPAADRLAFIGLARAFDPRAPDWHAADAPKLWRYNLHYFDYLHGPAFTEPEKRALVEDWITRVPPGPGDGWEPYPVSLRTVNWMKVLQAAGPAAVAEGWTASLALQLEALSHDLEYHLLANHLFKNAKALVFGGLCFEGPAAARWLRLGLDLLRAELREQFLGDGGHVERSPMYHAIMLEDLLDIVNLAAARAGALPADMQAELAGVAMRASGFFAGILGGDGEIPLFNDSALGITRPAADVIGYAARVLATAAPPAGATPRAVHCADSGYFGYRAGGDSLIVDCGPVGPDYQPGHAHCDTLSYELCLDGERVVVDSGVFDYEVGALRHQLRSTAAHNTVCVDGAEQSEVWGAFRVARRARPLHAALEGGDGQWRFTGAHDGYRRLPGAVVHEREIRIDAQRGTWTVTDRLQGRGRHRAESFVHLRPGLEVRLDAAGGVADVLDGGRPLLRITPVGPVRVGLREGWYCPRFGERAANAVVVFAWDGEAPGEFGYVLRRIGERDRE